MLLFTTDVKQDFFNGESFSNGSLAAVGMKVREKDRSDRQEDGQRRTQSA